MRRVCADGQRGAGWPGNRSQWARVLTVPLTPPPPPLPVHLNSEQRTVRTVSRHWFTGTGTTRIRFSVFHCLISVVYLFTRQQVKCQTDVLWSELSWIMFLSVGGELGMGWQQRPDKYLCSQILAHDTWHIISDRHNLYSYKYLIGDKLENGRV